MTERRLFKKIAKKKIKVFKQQEKLNTLKSEYRTKYGFLTKIPYKGKMI